MNTTDIGIKFFHSSLISSWAGCSKSKRTYQN